MNGSHDWAKYVSLTVLLAIVVVVLPAVRGVAPGQVLPMVKVGLVAPFEGAQRTMAYDALFAVKLAIERYNEQVRHTGGPLVELVSLDDGGRPENSRQQAQEMAVDPVVLGVVGPWSVETASSSIPVFQHARLGVVLPGMVGSNDGVPPKSEGLIQIDPSASEVKNLSLDQEFVSSFSSVAGHSPSSQAALAYTAMNSLLRAVEEGRAEVTRERVFTQLRSASKPSG
jgi:hypothetical protein